MNTLEQDHMASQHNQEACDLLVPERALWSCVEAMPDLSAMQASAMWSLAIGAAHSFAARSMLFPIFKALRPASVVETGTFHGLTSAFMWRLGYLNKKRPRLMTFDLEASDLAPCLWANLGAADQITFVRGDSGIMVRQCAGSNQEFVLIDGDHTYAGAQRDWEAIHPLLAHRSVVFFDNMRHSGGCGRFFETLDPLWFHPDMAILVRGLSNVELHSAFTFYIQRLLPTWATALASTDGNEVRTSLRSVIELLSPPPPDVTDYREIANTCRNLSWLSSSAAYPPLSECLVISSQYGIGTVRQARRQRALEALPESILPWARRLYHLVCPAHPKSA